MPRSCNKKTLWNLMAKMIYYLELLIIINNVPKGQVTHLIFSLSLNSYKINHTHTHTPIQIHNLFHTHTHTHTKQEDCCNSSQQQRNKYSLNLNPESLHFFIINNPWCKPKFNLHAQTGIKVKLEGKSAALGPWRLQFFLFLWLQKSITSSRST